MSTEKKENCRQCGGHMAYPSEYVGRTIDCPHCGVQITLGQEPPKPATAAVSRRKLLIPICATVATVILTIAIVVAMNRKSKNQAAEASSGTTTIPNKAGKRLNVEGSVFLIRDGNTAKHANARVTVIAASSFQEEVKRINETLKRSNAIAEEMKPIFDELAPKMQTLVQIKGDLHSAMYGIQLSTISKGERPLIDGTFQGTRFINEDLVKGLRFESDQCHAFWAVTLKANRSKEFGPAIVFDKKLVASFTTICTRMLTPSDISSFIPTVANSIKEEVQTFSKHQSNRQLKDYPYVAARAVSLMEDAAKSVVKYDASKRTLEPLKADILQSLGKLDLLAAGFTNYLEAVLTHLHSLGTTASTVRQASTDADGKFSTTVEAGTAYMAIASVTTKAAGKEETIVWVKRFTLSENDEPKILISNEQLTPVPSGFEKLGVIEAKLL